MTILDLTNKTFGRLTAMYRIPHKKPSEVRWFCRCLCGKEASIRLQCLTQNKTRSCGCLRREMVKDKNTIHGMTSKGTYNSWANMIQRCTNKNHPQFDDYGGRGITVDPAWLSFVNFYADMGDRPKQLTLERVNNDLGYCKANCKWATRYEQTHNRRKCKRKKAHQFDPLILTPDRPSDSDTADDPGDNN